MPLPMVHLAVAVKMVGIEARDLSADTLLGSIAPDAIHMRPNTGRHDKSCVHLADQEGFCYLRARKLLTQDRCDDHEMIGFTEGYVAHILTDFLWQDNVIEPAYQHLHQELSEDEQGWLYNQETSQIDIDLYHQMPWRAAAWSKLAAIQPYNFGSLLTSGEIGLWRDFVLGWYEGEEHQWEMAPTYITHAKTLDFIDQASMEIRELFREWKPSVWIDP